MKDEQDSGRFATPYVLWHLAYVTSMGDHTRTASIKYLNRKPLGFTE